MGCRIFVGHEAGCELVEQTCLFDSVKMVAFGPIMNDHQEAEAFVGYLDEKGYPDPRLIGASELSEFWYPHFVPWYQERLCKDCDQFETETKGSVCDSCCDNRRAETDRSASDRLEETVGHGGMEGTGSKDPES